MSNLDLYNRVRAVPEEAKKPIEAGRLKGKTDISPIFRIKTLTQEFGQCGIGWKAPIKRLWKEEGNGGEVAAFCEIELFYKQNGEWSEGITGIGGSMLVSMETKGLYTDDECYKKAYTDALSVACKALGVAADVYWEKDATKYDKTPDTAPTSKPSADPASQNVGQSTAATVPSERDIAYAKQITIKYGEYAGRLLADLTTNELYVVASGTNEYLKKNALVLINAGGGVSQPSDATPEAEEELPF